MTVLHSGTTEKYSDNWDNVFAKKKTKKKTAAKKKTTAKKKASPKKKSSQKKAKK